MLLRPGARLLPAAVTGSLSVLLVFAPAAAAATGGGQLVPVAFLGLPSLHSIIEAIAKGFFSALAGALVPGFLKHGTVATIQHLVALPDPATWGHVGELESDMTYLGMSLMPVTLAVCTLRYWMMGLTGAAHPVTALGRCGWATGVLVIYRWLVEQTVAATNTLTHAILGFPVVANGLASIITILFAGALLAGAGGVFGAFLVIVGVLFGAALFASSEALTVLLALVFCAGPPFIALAPIPELSHLARVWGHALMAIVLVPIGWTILFATAGALTLDATSVTHGAGALPGHIAAAFAGLITFILAVKLPLMLFGELRHILGGALRGGSTGTGSQTASAMPGAERMRAAHTRLRSFALEGVPSVGRSAGRAAGAIGAPEGGPLGTTRRGLASAARRTGLASGMTPAGAGAGALGGMAAGRAGAVRRGGVRERLTRARTILNNAPRDARAAMTSSSARATRVSAQRGSRAASTRRTAATAPGRTPAQVAAGKAQVRGTTVGVSAPTRSTSGGSATSRTAAPRAQPAQAPSPAAPRSTNAGKGTAHPGRQVSSNARRDANGPPRASQPPAGPPKAPPAQTPPPPRSKGRKAPRRTPPGRSGR
ncbi:MAG TPA: hypothetical protein VFR48_10230 [Solirubrobacteraceae bacterium]|nr:hypothetical protein [Solirubrobacteraceae bacterium]